MRTQLALTSLALSLACANSSESTDQLPTCDEIVESIAACLPEAAEEGECTQTTREAFADYDGDLFCEDLAKSDWFAFGGCAANERVCGLIFCCDIDYDITWLPEDDSDWDIIPVIDTFQLTTPDVDLALVDEDGLADGVSWSYEQDIKAHPMAPAKRLAVEYTAGLLDIAFEDLEDKLPVADWGTRLDHHIGGEVIPYEPDEQGRSRQLERMVLSTLPLDSDIKLTNNDMTKVEVIVYREQSAKVYWRVMHSNNNSTVTDVGSVEFSKWDENRTLVIFHSGHELNSLGGVHIPNFLLKPLLKMTFLDFIHGYQELVR